MLDGGRPAPHLGGAGRGRLARGLLDRRRRGTLVRGQPGSVGELHGATSAAWASARLGRGRSRAVGHLGERHSLDEVVQNLRVGTFAEFEGMRRAAIDRVPTAAGGCTDGTVVTAVDGDLRWDSDSSPTPTVRARGRTAPDGSP